MFCLWLIKAYVLDYPCTPLFIITPYNPQKTVVIYFVSMNKELISFQNIYVFLPRLCQGNG